jgi:hypothetical protein
METAMFRKAHQGPALLLSLAFALLLLSGDALTDARAAEQPAPESATGQPSQPGTLLEEGGSILGKEVRSAADEKLGRIIDVIVDRAGAPRAALIDFGGFLGVGSRKIAVAWDLLSFSAAPGDDRITVQTTRDRLNTAPEFRQGKPIMVLTARDVEAPTQITVRMPER